MKKITSNVAKKNIINFIFNKSKCGSIIYNNTDHYYGRKVMLSYKEWKLYTESLGGAIPLGVRTPQNVGITGLQPEVVDFEMELEEAKRRLNKCSKCKKMDGEVEVGNDEPVEEKPKLKKPIDDESDVDVDEPKDDEEDVEGEEGVEGEEEPGVEKPKAKVSPEEEEPAEKEKPTLFQKKKQGKNMKKEDVEFLNSLRTELGDVLTNSRFWGGLQIEDALLAPVDPNDGLTEPENQ
jgi:hypothetical protein